MSRSFKGRKKRNSWQQICPQKKDKQSRRQSERAENILLKKYDIILYHEIDRIIVNDNVDYIDPSFIVGAKDKDESIAMFAFQGRGNGWVDRGKHCLCPKKQFPAIRQTLRL